jgi:hypothetical protein
MQINRSPIKQPTIQSPSNILSNAKIKTFRKLDRRGSIFNLIKDAKALKNNILELEEENSNDSSSQSSEIESNSSVSKSVKKFKSNLQTLNKALNKDNNTHKHKYKENMLPILTTSNQILTEADLVNKRDEYYKRNLSNSNNYGRKFARRNLTFKSFETKNEEEFIQLIGLNDEEKDPLKVIQGKKIDMNIKNMKNEKINISNINTNNFNFLLLKAAKQKIENKKLLVKSKKSRKSVDLKHILIKYKEEISRNVAFDKVTSHLSYLESKNGWFFFDKGFCILTDREFVENRDISQAFVYIIILIALTFGIYGIDYNNSEMVLLRTTVNGRRRLDAIKGALGLLSTVISFTLIYIIRMANVLSAYGTKGLQAPASSMEHLSSIPQNVSVLQYLFIIMAMRLIAGVIVVITVFLITKLLKNGFYAIALCILLFVLPLSLVLLKVPNAEYILLNPLLIGNVF